MATGGEPDLDRDTDETFDFLCSMCQKKNKNTDGEHFCANCSNYYCSTQDKVHDDEVPPLQFKPSMTVQFPAVPTERCTVHGHEPVDMFCRQHDSVGCVTCMEIQHSDCKEKFYVPDYIKNNTTAANPNNIIEQTDVVATSVAQCQKEFMKEKKYLGYSRERSLKQIRKWRIEINGVLDELENKTIQELEQKFQSLIDKIETALRELQALTTDIQSTQKSLKSAGGNLAQMFVSIKMAKEVASLAQEKVNTTQSQFSSTEISFEPYPKLQSVLQKIQALGDISLTETVNMIQTSHTFSESPGTTASLSPTTMTQTSNTFSESPATTASLLPTTMTQKSHTFLESPATTASLLPTTMTQTSNTFLESPATTASLLPTTMIQTSHTFLESPATTASLLPTTMTQKSHTFLESPATTASLLPTTMTQTSNTFSESPGTTASLSPTTMTQTSHTFSESPATTASFLPTTMTQTSFTLYNRTRQQSCDSQTKPPLLQVKDKKSYTVKVKSDGDTCGIYSACTLADGTIILADFWNRKLKRVNGTSFTVTEYCEVPDYPYQVCVIVDQEVAVSCGCSNLIQFVSIGKIMQKTRQINTGFECIALAYADGKLFVSDWDTSVYMYTMSGDRLKQFSKDQSGTQIFSFIKSIAVSSDYSKLYVADRNKGLIILDRYGQLVGQFDGEELFLANGVCLHKNDSVLVCGYLSKNVLQFCPDGELLGEILKTDVGCRLVCCNKDNTKLIVGLELNDEIEVYEIN